MATNERFPLLDQTWFDPNHPEPLHDALRVDYTRVHAHAQQRPSLRRHMQHCPVCQAIGGFPEQTPAPTVARKRLKLVINPQQMHQLLRLPENFEIVHMYAADDPNTVSVLVAGEGLPMVADTDETPTGRLDVLGDAET